MKFELPKKKQQTLPENKTCRNCGAQTIGHYCHECGQSVFAGMEQPIFKLIGELLSNAFALDNKTPRTLKLLMLRPGFLSEEYHIGKINSYVHPVKLFWMSTLIFFALLIGNIDPGNEKTILPKEETSTSMASPAVNKIENSNSEENATAIQIEKMETDKVIKNIKKEDIIKYFSMYAPYATFLLMPIFALLLLLFFWRNKYYYMYHLTFAIHFHAFMWIYFSLLIITDLIIPNVVYPDIIALLLVFLPGIYLAVALRRFYKTKKRKSAVWKAIFITLLYATLVLLLTILIALCVFQMMGWLDN